MPVHKTLKHFDRGFTLIEVVIVVAILGILASIAVPSFRSFTCRSKRSEAKVNLKHLESSITAYLREHETSVFVVSVRCDGTVDDGGLGDPIGFVPQGKSNYRYDYWGFPADGSGRAFGATAAGCTGMAGDLWSFAEQNGVIDQAPEICDSH